jgi:hypothetical protein
MAITREQWIASELAKAPGKSRDARVAIETSLLQQAAVASELLTGHPAWDVYVQRLQVSVESADHELQDWQRKIVGAYEDADLRVIQIQIAVLRDRLATLNACILLPHRIIEEMQSQTHRSTRVADTLDKSAQ